MILSKVMQQSDYDELKSEYKEVQEVAELCGGWPAVQHMHRMWEYSLVLRVLRTWLKDYKDKNNIPLVAADIGGGIGFTTPLLLVNKFAVAMYEPWLNGNESAKFWEQVNNYRDKTIPSHAVIEINYGLLSLRDRDRNHYDAVFCISTLEHIRNYQSAWEDLLSMVKPGGLVFITTDYGEHELDNYAHSGLRAGRMFTANQYSKLIGIAKANNFEVLGDEYIYDWKEEYRMVNDYGFASLAVVRK